uniref:Uncharacterized protein n=1 Tax=Micrurus carvalhoi TaxID=3147026 RepID=A0A2H6N1X6_9SAUR
MCFFKCKHSINFIFYFIKRFVFLSLILTPKPEVSRAGVSNLGNFKPGGLQLAEFPSQQSKKYFDDLNKMMLKFIWKGKKTRIKIKLLQDARVRGGFGLPNWELYY